jgi:hypothetical protein
LAAAGLIIIAFARGYTATKGLPWPYDPDQFRDIAFAQTALDGHPMADASYVGEWIWYNPLISWLVAGVCFVTGLPPMFVNVAAGPVLNLLGPIAFYLFARVYVGRSAGIVALALSLFLLCWVDCWACATYSPWLFSSTFGIGPFFLGGFALVRTVRQPSGLNAALAGALLGATFLSHTAPALILGVLTVALLPWRLTVVGALTAFVVASPFLASIGAHYRLAIVNQAPLQWHYGPLTKSAFGATLRANSVWLLGGTIGLWWVRDRLIWVWLSATFAFALWGLAETPIVPAFHFWIYFQFALLLLCGVAISRLLRWRPAVFMAVITALLVVLPLYATRQDFTTIRSIAAGRDPNFALMTETLRSVTATDDVVLGTYGAANLIIGPAGRKVVAPHEFTANPYVRIEERRADREAMLKAVQQHDVARFMGLAPTRRVTFVLSVGPDECAAAESFSLLEPVVRHGDVCLARVRYVGRSR